MARDEFGRKVREALCRRVGGFCSNPDCRRATAGPHTDPARWVNLGMAAHITAAAPGGPRYDAALTTAQRGGVENGIWLCQDCGKLIDSDEERHPAPLLHDWRTRAEAETNALLTSDKPPRPPGALVAVSEPLKLGSLAWVDTAGGTCLRTYVADDTTDPTLYSGGLVFRSVLKVLDPARLVVVQAIGVEVLAAEPVPEYRDRMGMHMPRIALYLVDFDDPAKNGVRRHTGRLYCEPKEEGHAAQSYQPVALDPELPEVFDIRLMPRSPGLFTLRVYATLTAGVDVCE